MLVFFTHAAVQTVAISAAVFVVVAFPLIALAQPLVQCSGADNCNMTTLLATIRAVINWLLTISAVIGAALFCYAGVLYATSAGNTGQISKAHGIFWNVLIGITIAFAAWLIIKSILDAISINAGYSGI